MSSPNGNRIAKELQSKLGEWMLVTRFPSVVHLELLAANIIPDPNQGQNERLLQWVGDADWEYSVNFPSPQNLAAHEDLVLEGLDTIATVRLNGVDLLKSDNMFLPARLNVKDSLRANGEDNELIIAFDSAEKIATEREAKFGVLGPAILRGTKRMHIRKAQVR